MMDQIQKILVPTDFSAHADEAFRVSLTVARLTEAEIILFHVVRPPAVVSEGGVAVPIPPNLKGALVADPNNFFLTPFASCTDCAPRR